MKGEELSVVAYRINLAGAAEQMPLESTVGELFADVVSKQMNFTQIAHVRRR